MNMLIKENIIFHSIFEEFEVKGKTAISRFPKEVCKNMEHNVYSHLQNVELRFKTKSKVKLNIIPHGAWQKPELYIYYGDYPSCTSYKLNAYQDNIIEFEYDPEQRKNLKSTHFSSEITRFIVSGEMLEINILESDCEPIDATELPSHTLLSYGSSITQGQYTLAPDCAYPFIVSRELGFDNLNLGLSGQCLIEKETSDFITLLNADLYILELGVNMIGQEYSCDEFTKRAKYLLEKLKYKQALIIDIPFSDYDLEPKSALMQEYRTALREVIKEVGSPMHVFVENTAFDSIEDKTFDLIHPSTRGMNKIADRLLEIIKGNWRF